MSTLVTFYALTNSKQDAGVTTNNQPIQVASELTKAAELVIAGVGSRKKITVLCDSQAQAEAFDEFIWQYPADKFIPHNLYGEGPEIGTPVEIIWESVYLSMTKLRNRALVINLSQAFIEKHHEIKHIIDFVPVDDTQKIQARERYKRYKQSGCQLEYKSA